MARFVSNVMANEYRSYVDDIGVDAPDEAIAQVLVSRGDWTGAGAATVVRLARAYGTSVLCNALALASALQIEDGESGL